MENQNNNNKQSRETDKTSLQNFSRRNVFQTPVNYFEKLPVTVADRIHATDREVPGHNWAVIRAMVITGVASIAVVIGGIYFSGDKSEKNSMASLTFDDIESAGVVVEMDESLLFDEYQSREPESSEIPSGVNLENELYKEYLIENNTDISLILNEL